MEDVEYLPGRVQISGKKAERRWASRIFRFKGAFLTQRTLWEAPLMSYNSLQSRFR